MYKLFTLAPVLRAIDGPLTDSSGNILKITPQELLRAPSAPRVEQFLLQFSQDHEVTVEEVDIMLTAYTGLDGILGRALKSRAQIIIQRFGTEDARQKAQQSGLMDR